MALGVSWDGPPVRDTTSERDLFTGYSGVVGTISQVRPEAVEPCACGGVVRVSIDEPAWVEAAVRAHQGTVRHRIWRTAMEASR